MQNETPSTTEPSHHATHSPASTCATLSSVGTGSISKAPVVVLLILAVQGGWCGLGRLTEMAFPLDTHPNTETYFGNISETQIPAGSDRSA